MPGAVETKIHLPYQHRAFRVAVCRPAKAERTGRQSVQWQPSGFTHELRDEHKAEANVVVAVGGGVVVAIRGTAVTRIVVPVPAAQNTVRTHDCRPFQYFMVKSLICTVIKFFLRIVRRFAFRRRTSDKS